MCIVFGPDARGSIVGPAVLNAGSVASVDRIAMAGMESDVRAVAWLSGLAVNWALEAEQNLGETVRKNAFRLLDAPQSELRHHRVVKGFGFLQIVRTEGDVMDHGRSLLG
jgi:hypothetical protein